MTQPDSDLAWSVCLSLPFDNKEEWRFVTKQMDDKFNLNEEETLYLPPEMKDGILKSGLLVSEGILVQSKPSETTNQSDGEVVVESENTPVTPMQQVEQGESNIEDEIAQRERNEQTGSNVEILGLDEHPSVLAEEEGDSLGGSAEAEGTQDISVEGITDDIPRSQLVVVTQEDHSLEPLRILAQLEKEGYHMKQGLLFRSRLDSFGQVREQICLPIQYRARCLKLAHSNFGHQGRNEMVELIKPFFHWPTMTKDCLNHIKACHICQKMDKSVPRRNEMQIRKMTTVPFERVAVDLVGPFPTAVGGFRFMLTCIDMATRWPEAIPIHTTTAKVLITQLTNIFSCCGFPHCFNLRQQ